MPVVFFEGFNFSNEDTVKLNPDYWSSSSGFSFTGGRTGNCVVLPNRAQNTALSGNSWLKLSNFTDPLATYSCIGIGFYVPPYGIVSGVGDYTEPNFENLMSLTTSNGTLSIDMGRAADGYTTLVVRENGATMGTYDFRSVLGNSWNLSVVQGPTGSIVNPMYLDFFFNAASGSFSVRAEGNSTLSTPLYNSSSSATTAITRFSSVTEVKLYGHQTLNYFGNPTASFDDFYFTAGNALADVFLGPNTRVYRLHPSSTVSDSWISSNGSPAEYLLPSNDGDSSYIKSAVTGNTALLSVANLPGGAPAYVKGVKVFNVVRKAGLDNQSMVNVMASTSGGTPQEIGTTYSLTSETYSLKENTFLTNPITSSAWTATEVNNMVLGVKNKT